MPLESERAERSMRPPSVWKENLRNTSPSAARAARKARPAASAAPPASTSEGSPATASARSVATRRSRAGARAPKVSRRRWISARSWSATTATPVGRDPVRAEASCVRLRSDSSMARDASTLARCDSRSALKAASFSARAVRSWVSSLRKDSRVAIRSASCRMRPIIAGKSACGAAPEKSLEMRTASSSQRPSKSFIWRRSVSALESLRKSVPAVFTKRKTSAPRSKAAPSAPRTLRVVRIMAGIFFSKSSPPRKDRAGTLWIGRTPLVCEPRHCAVSAVTLFAEIRFADAGISQQHAGLPGDGHHASLQDVAAVAHLEGETGILLHQQQRNPFRGDRADHLEDLLHHEGRQAHARLVEEEELGPH